MVVVIVAVVVVWAGFVWISSVIAATYAVSTGCNESYAVCSSCSSTVYSFGVCLSA